MRIVSDIGLRLAIARLDKIWFRHTPGVRHYKERCALVSAIEEYENRTLPPPWGNKKETTNGDDDV